MPQPPLSSLHPDGPVILLTGFDPFGGDIQNPSWLIAQALHGQRIAGHTVVAEQLPTVFGASLSRLQTLVQTWQPNVTLCLGQAGGRARRAVHRAHRHQRRRRAHS